MSMNNSMVAHLWAHEQEESASGSNFFFEGTSIYSYGHGRTKQSIRLCFGISPLLGVVLVQY